MGKMELFYSTKASTNNANATRYSLGTMGYRSIANNRGTMAWGFMQEPSHLP